MPGRSEIRSSATVLAAALFVILEGSAASGQIERAKDAPKPSPPEVSRTYFHLREGFRIELVAAEPLLADPTAVAWDEDGRFFACELHGYNLEGHLDVLELNKTGKLDRVVRRIPASPEARKAAEKDTYGTVKRLIDDDGDGRMDRVEVWADRIPPAYGILPWRGGLFVTCAPHILYLADRDGDGNAEVREVVFTGFGRGPLERGINNPRWGPDGWIYVAAGRGGTITGPRLARPVHLGNTDFRFRPDGTALEPVTGANGTFGLAMTDFGERFLLNTSHHALYAVPLPYRALARNPYLPAPRTVEDAADYTRIYPVSEPHPWRRIRGQDPAWVRFYGVHEATPSGFFTSACGQLIYRADGFPEPYRGNLFACDPQNNIVHRSLIERDGAGFKVRRAPGEERREFLASEEKWFRPINLAVGPDAALYIVDMYREIIEDYSAIPRFLQQQYGLIEGNDRGRVWRLAHEGMKTRAAPRLSETPPAELVRLLAHPNAWWRETAQRLLMERGDRSVIPELEHAVRHSPSAPARILALYVLERLQALGDALLEEALSDASYGVRVHALRLAGERLDRAPGLLREAIALAQDPDPSVRLQAALTLGASGAEEALDALTRCAREHGGERWMAHAVACVRPEYAARVAERLLASAGDPGQSGGALRLLAATAGARYPEAPGEPVQVLEAAARAVETGRVEAAEVALAGLAEGLRRSGRRPSREVEARFAGASARALERILEHSGGRAHGHALEIAGFFGLSSSPALKAVFERAAGAALDAKRAEPERIRALELLSSGPFDLLAAAAEELLAPSAPPALALAAVRALERTQDPRAAEVLLRGWKAYTPKIQEAALEALFARTDRLPALLSAIEEGRVAPATLSRFHRLRLLENPDPEIAARARKVLGTSPPLSQETVSEATLERYARALSQTHDARRGRALFERHCLPCHRLGKEGHAVGPDLASARTRSDLTLLNDILRPSADIASGYATYVALTSDGRAIAGVLAAESASSITLRRAGGVEETVLRRNLLSLEASPLSLMPENLAELLAPADVAALIAFLRAAFGGELPARVVLFDEEADFARRLTKGGGTAAVDSEDACSGRFSLRVTPLQRYSERIPGWNFAIRERPEPGEFRYLRLAWKSEGGRGVMVELAAGGEWPPAESPVRRYYSGENLTEWKAHRVAERAPEEWTVVTLDLWKDNGAFLLTGIAPTAMGGPVRFDRIELLRTLDEVRPGPSAK